MRHLYIISLLMILAAGSIGHGQPAIASTDDVALAPLFTLKSLEGQHFHLSQRRDAALSLLYFSSAEAHGRPEFLMTMSELLRALPETRLHLWGICNNRESVVKQWRDRHRLEMPILVDDGHTSERYNAALVLPALIVIGPDLQILSVLQGPEATFPAQITLVAQWLSQRGFVEAARWLCEKGITADPTAVDTQHLLAYLNMQSGQYDRAEQIFFKLSRRTGMAAVRGQEGLAAVYAARGKTDRAMDLAGQITKQAKKRAAAINLQGCIQLTRGDLTTAEKSFNKALKKKDGSSDERAYAINQLGRIAMIAGDPRKAQRLFEEAFVVAPLFSTPRYNLGLLRQSRDEWQRALEIFKHLRTLEPESAYAAALAANAEAMLTFREDTEARAQMDAEIDSLVKRISAGPWEWVPPEDDWTTEPLRLALLEPIETSGISAQAGYPVVLNWLVRQQLMGSGRVEPVDPIQLSILLQRIKASPEAVSTKAFANKLGRILGARIVGMGAFHHGVVASQLNYRLFDARKGVEVARLELPIHSHLDLAPKAARLAGHILETAVKSTPLQAYVVEVHAERVLLNLGAGQGVTVGRFFDVIEEQSFIEYKGKTLYPSPIRFARLEVVQVAQDFCFAKIVHLQRPIKRNDKVLEDISDLMVTRMPQ
ncbi:MAG: redoxin domain-containing protein [Desulfosarcinaceae bacterium]|nr:redoxin domain-containing protein [Desulfosarcinaceae bacterium]